LTYLESATLPIRMVKRFLYLPFVERDDETFIDYKGGTQNRTKH